MTNVITASQEPLINVYFLYNPRSFMCTLCQVFRNIVRINGLHTVVMINAHIDDETCCVRKLEQNLEILQLSLPEAGMGILRLAQS